MKRVIFAFLILASTAFGYQDSDGVERDCVADASCLAMLTIITAALVLRKRKEFCNGKY